MVQIPKRFALPIGVGAALAILFIILLVFPNFGTAQRCVSNNEWASIDDVRGFATIKRYQGAPPLQENLMTPGRKPGLYEFVLAPNSTGYITMVYDTCSEPITATIGNNVSQFFSSLDTHTSGINKFDSNEESESFRTGQAIWVPGNNAAPVQVYSSIVKQENEHRVVVTYTISADSKAIPGVYIMNLYHTCPGELLTIGDKPHQGDIPWTHGTFYGCSF